MRIETVALLINGALFHFYFAPLHWVELADEKFDGFLLLWVDRRIEGDHRALHLALGEVAAEVARHPKFGAVHLGVADVAVVDLDGVVELAVVSALRAGVEV